MHIDWKDMLKAALAGVATSEGLDAGVVVSRAAELADAACLEIDRREAMHRGAHAPRGRIAGAL